MERTYTTLDVALETLFNYYNNVGNNINGGNNNG